MKEPRLSVLVLTYHPQKDALFSTLRSVILQKDCDFEVVVCDDGSGTFFREEIEAFLESHKVDYQILAHAENQGTVKNIIDGVKVARGAYIKPISPGDFFYDDTTLRDIANFMQTNNALAAFGKMVFYSDTDALQVKNLTFPILPDIYGAPRYHYRKALKQQAVFNDFISGASAIYEKAAFLQALEAISPVVRYAEDIVFQYFSLQNIRIFAIPRLIVWYEYGSGISTKKTTQAFTRVEEDFYRFYHHMTELYPKNPYMKRACRIWQLRKEGNSAKSLINKLLPDKILFSLRARIRKKQLTIPPYEDQFFREVKG